MPLHHERNIDRPKGRSLKPLRALWPYLRQVSSAFWCSRSVALLIASAAMLVLPLAFRNVIDQGMVVQDRATIDFYFVAFLAAAVAFGLFAALRFYLVTWLGERVVADVRSDIYARVIRMDPTFFEVTRTGEVLSRLTTDTTLVQVDRRREPVDHAALGDSAGRRARAADRHQPVARRHDPDRHSAGDRAADRSSVAGCARCRANRRIESPTPAAWPAKR